MQNTSTKVLIPLDINQACCKRPCCSGPASVRAGSSSTDPAECASVMHKAIDSQQHKYSSNTRGLLPGTDFRKVDTIRPTDALGALERHLFA